MPSVVLHPAQAETASGQGTSTIGGGNILIGMFVNVSSVSGVLPTLVIKLQHSPNGNDWYDVSGVTTGSLAGILLTPLIPAQQQLVCDNVRVVWTVGGVNPSFTFEIELDTI